SAGHFAPAGVVSATADFSGAFGGINYGTDGPGSANFALVLNGDDVPSGLYALDPTDTTLLDGDGIGQGDEILLNQNPDGSITGSVNGTDYFTISVDASTGEVTFTQSENVWHAD